MRNVFVGSLFWVLVTGAAMAGPLHIAARDGDQDEVAALIAAGEDVNERDRLLGWPLHQAALKNFTEIAQALIAAGADVNADHKTFGTPLHAAAQRGSAETAQLLLASGANVDAVRSDGVTALHVAAGNGDADFVEVLVTARADVNARSQRKEDWTSDFSATHSAAANGHLGIVALLRSFGATGVTVEPLGKRLASADPVAGESAFHAFSSELGCHTCHSWEPGNTRRSYGPNLAGIVDQPKASYPDFTYSDALMRLGGNWTVAELNAFLTSPRDFAPGSDMEFFGIRDPERRANIIAYLVSISR